MEYNKLSDKRLGEPLRVISKRVESARQVQGDQFSVGLKYSLINAKGVSVLADKNTSPIICNVDMRPVEAQMDTISY